MRIPRIYTPQPLTLSASIELEESASHHLLKVLRMQPGRELIIFNNTGREYTATIVSATKKSACVAITRESTVNRESPLTTELAIGLSRGERFDWVLQKATELGVTRIAPLMTERTEVKLNEDRLQKRQQQWQKIIIGACEQCQRNTLPDIMTPVTLPQYLAQCQAQTRFVLHHRAATPLNERPPPTSITVLIGPEGGLNDNEIDLAEQHQFQPLQLGPRVLRTETAPIAALAIVQNIWGDV